MTPREQAAFRAGIETMRQMAMAAAVSIEVRDDASETRQRAAVAALQGLAEGARLAFLCDDNQAFGQVNRTVGAPDVLMGEACCEPELNRQDETDAG